jgi:hypothetical protein
MSHDVVHVDYLKDEKEPPNVDIASHFLEKSNNIGRTISFVEEKY